MWGEIERCYKRRSDILPEIPDITQGVTDDMFLSTYEKKAMKKKGNLLYLILTAKSNCYFLKNSF